MTVRFQDSVSQAGEAAGARLRGGGCSGVLQGLACCCCLGLGMLSLPLAAQSAGEAVPQVQVASAEPGLLQRLAAAARERSHALAAARAGGRAAGERVDQARAALGPNLNASVSRSHTRTENLDPTLFSPAGPQDAYISKQVAQISQPLYRGVAWSAWRQAELQQAAAVLEQEVALLEVDQRLVAAWLDVLNAQEQLNLTLAQKRATAEQMALARRSFTVGTVSVTDVREAEAKFDAVAAQEEAARYDLLARREALIEWVGPQTPLPQVFAGLVEEPGGGAAAAASDEVLEVWLERSRLRHPSLRQAGLQAEAARQEVEMAERAHWPTLDASASHVRTRGGAASLTASGHTRVTQAELTFTLPLFAAGATQAKVREALALEDKAHADLEAARQTVRSNVRQAWFALQAALAQVRALQTAERSAQTALKANRRAYEVGLRINADVLAAQSQWFEARRDLVRARHEVWLQRSKLAAAAGTLGDADLARLEAQFAPDETARPAPAESRP